MSSAARPSQKSNLAEKIEFGSLQAANDWRDTNPDSLAGSDNRSEKTVRLAPDVDDRIPLDAGKKAEISRSGNSKTYGFARLTDKERDYLEHQYNEWTWNTHGKATEAAKAALQAEGAVEWLDYYEPGERKEGALGNLEAAKGDQADTGANNGLKGYQIDSDPDPGELGERLDQAAGERDRYLLDTVRDHIDQYGSEKVRAVLNGNPESVSDQCERDIRSVIEAEGPDVYSQELQARENLDPGSGELPEPQIEPEPEPDPSPIEGSDPADIRAAVESVDDRPAEPEPDKNGFSWISFASWIGRRTGREIGRTLRTIGLLAWVFLQWAIPAAGREGKRSAVILARVAGFILGYSIRIAAFTAGLAAAVTVAFGKGAVNGATA